MLKIVIETLTSRGYVYIGMDHFAREDDELAIAQRSGTLQRNFQGYSTRGGTDILAFGMSSISQTTNHYRQNDKSLDTYYKRLDQSELPISRALFLSEEDKIRRAVIMELMCNLTLDFNAMSTGLGIDFCDRFAPEIAAFEDPAADGLVELTPNGIMVTDSGRLLLRNLAMIFDEHLNNSQARFSRTV
jgi:oxygen-independent coproporphyrinogen-3 oxidase